MAQRASSTLWEHTTCVRYVSAIDAITEPWDKMQEQKPQPGPNAEKMDFAVHYSRLRKLQIRF
jgi:hypothetical protein